MRPVLGGEFPVPLEVHICLPSPERENIADLRTHTDHAGFEIAQDGRSALVRRDLLIEVIEVTDDAELQLLGDDELGEGLPRLEGDRIQLQQVMLNLINNAVQGMSAAGIELRDLAISSKTDRDGIVVTVRDSGLG